MLALTWPVDRQNYRRRPRERGKIGGADEKNDGLRGGTDVEGNFKEGEWRECVLLWRWKGGVTIAENSCNVDKRERRGVKATVSEFVLKEWLSSLLSIVIPYIFYNCLLIYIWNKFYVHIRKCQIDN